MYQARDWDNTGITVTKDDFKRIEGGIESNEQQINVLSGGNVKPASDINVTDANNLPIGWYSGNLSNSPTTDWYTYHTFNKLGDGYRTQIAYGVNTNRLYHRIYLNDSYQKWSFFGDDYREVTNDDLRNGFKVRTGFVCYLSRSGNNVVLNLNMSSSVSGAGIIVAQIPDGWRPLTSVGCVGCFGVNSKTFCGELSTDGTLRFWDFSSGDFGDGELTRLSITYRVEG